ncbi:histone-fold-containing protein, partial [Rhexocercosporidium sp. MPI-PUGE-AT-0058]
KAPRKSIATKSATKSNTSIQPQRARVRSGYRALRETRKLQGSVDLLIPALPFQSLIHEIARRFMEDVRFKGSAIRALQESAESFLVRHFEMTNLAAIHSKRVTIQAKDSALVKRI